MSSETPRVDFCLVIFGSRVPVLHCRCPFDVPRTNRMKRLSLSVGVRAHFSVRTHWVIAMVEMAVIHTHGIDNVDSFISLDGENGWKERFPVFLRDFKMTRSAYISVENQLLKRLPDSRMYSRGVWMFPGAPASRLGINFASFPDWIPIFSIPTVRSLSRRYIPDTLCSIT